MGIRSSAAALLLLAGCTVGPNYESPSLWSPASWFRTTRTEKATGPVSLPVAAPIDVTWWDVLGDPELTSLMRRVAGTNLDVRTADLRLAQARAQRGISEAASYPTLDANGSYTRERPSKLGVISLISGGGASQATQASGLGGRQGAFPNSAGIGAFDLFQAGFDASWELDLWGKVRRQLESASAQVQASTEARRNTLLTSLAELARNYVQLRGLQESERIVRSNLSSAQQAVRLTEERVRGGLATDLDLANARAQAEATAANLPQLEAQELQAINAISLLLGEPPGAMGAELQTPKPVPPVPPAVPIGLPSELARRRPDIRQADALLHAATADIGVAEANFYPSVTLSGSVALQATQFTRVFDINALTYGVGPSISIPIFEGGRLTRTLELRKEAAKEAAVAYQRTVLQAFHEVDNALIAYRTDQLRRERLAAQASQSRRALGFATERYRSGLSDFLEVLTAQRTLLQAEEDLASATTTVSTDLIMLYKALGGGWEIGEPKG
ncbi:MAG: efflux transporter outer membrane subunit [Acetobacteraceae bacterium]|nr:efflux transporter outer membrane subunit [Acetobacteraceae bacterium]